MNPPVLLEGDHKSGETAQKAVKLQSEPISPVNHGSGTFNAEVFGVGRDFTGEELFEYQLEQPIIQHGELSVAGVGDRDPHLAASSRLVDLDTRMPVSLNSGFGKLRIFVLLQVLGILAVSLTEWKGFCRPSNTIEGVGAFAHARGVAG